MSGGISQAYGLTGSIPAVVPSALCSLIYRYNQLRLRPQVVFLWKFLFHNGVFISQYIRKCKG